MILLTQVFSQYSPPKYFPTSWISPQKAPTLSQEPSLLVLQDNILKLWTSPKDPQPRTSKYPKSFLIWFPWDSPSVLNKWVKECLNNVLDPVKSCHELHQLCRDFMLVHSTILNILQNCATIFSSRATIFAVTNLQVVDSKSCQDLPNCATILLKLKHKIISQNWMQALANANT